MVKEIPIKKVVHVRTLPSGGCTYQNEVISTFEEAGWALGDSGGGCQWLTKSFEDGLGGGFFALTDDGGLDAPGSWDEFCILGIYDQDGDDMGFTIKSTAQNIYWLMTAIMGADRLAKALEALALAQATIERAEGEFLAKHPGPCSPYKGSLDVIKEALKA